MLSIELAKIVVGVDIVGEDVLIRGEMHVVMRFWVVASMLARGGYSLCVGMCREMVCLLEEKAIVLCMGVAMQMPDAHNNTRWLACCSVCAW